MGWNIQGERVVVTGGNCGIGTPLSTWNFQFWYRDPLGGPAGFNFSAGLEVTSCP